MVYQSEITFTLDTICPWTYLAKTRLDRALTQFHQSSTSASLVAFNLRYSPYQLSPDLPQFGTPKHAWYRVHKFADSEDRTRLYEEYMKAQFEEDGIVFSTGDEEALTANTIQAHRVLQYAQEEAGNLVGEEKAGGLASKVLDGLYRAYFTDGKHPSDSETLVKALVGAGISEDEAKRIVDDGQLGLRDVQAKIREQAGNGVDSVPYVVIEGKRRDFTLVGAKSVEEYAKALEQVAKESK